MSYMEVSGCPTVYPDHTLVGDPIGVRNTLAEIERAGRNRLPVLLLGETGTGKGIIARRIHAVRGTGPFVTIDCSALVGELMESELFGHVKGSFTGAISGKIGLIEMADGGTAFLDEIGELPLELQAKLLRVIQEKEFRPVGSTQIRRSDFRVIAATLRDLATDVAEKKFRSDLYFRLKGLTIRLKPLRERREDISVLVNHFLRRYGNNHSITAEVMDALVAYDWPGNVREVELCVQHMIALSPEPLIHTAALTSMVLNDMRQRRTAYAVRGTAAGAETLQREFLPAAPAPDSTGPAVFGSEVIPIPELERRAIVHALEHTKGDRTMAAHLLQIGRTTLYRKIRDYGLD